MDRYDNIIKGYYGFYTDSKKLLSSSSGGFCSAVASWFLDSGKIVVGAVYSENFYQVEFRVIRTRNELSMLSGSKYVETVKEVVDGTERYQLYLYIANLLKKGDDVLFIGLGCDVGALLYYCQRNAIDVSNLFTIDLICHGPTFKQVHEQYILHLENKYKSKIKDFSVRYKKDGWVPPYLHAEFENGKCHNEKFYQSDYGIAFSMYARKSCYNCRFKGGNHKSDITAGDFWGLTPEMEEYNKNGVSAILVHTQKGEEIIQKIDKTVFFIREIDYKKIVDNNKMYYSLRKKHPNYDTFIIELDTKGLHRAIARTEGYFITFIRDYKINIMVKKILPNKLFYFIKRCLKK